VQAGWKMNFFSCYFGREFNGCYAIYQGVPALNENVLGQEMFMSPGGSAVSKYVILKKPLGCSLNVTKVGMSHVAMKIW
jgi:hypothetical protein